MKTKIKKLSRRTISLILACIILISGLIFSMITASAYNIYAVMSEGTDWSSNTIALTSNTQGNTAGNKTIHLNPGEYFKFRELSANKDVGPDVDTEYTPTSSDWWTWNHSSTKAYYLTDSWESGDFTISGYVQYEKDKGADVVKWHMTRATTDTWYLSGVINGSNTGKSSSDYTFTKSSSNAYTYTKTFIANGQDQYFTVNNGSLVYECGSSDGASGASANSVYWGLKEKAVDGSKKWKISGSSAPTGSSVTVTWNSKDRTLSWSITLPGYYIHKGADGAAASTASGTAMTKVNSDQYTYELSAGTYQFNINTVSGAASSSSSNAVSHMKKAKKTSSAINMDAGAGDSGTVNQEYTISKSYNVSGTSIKLVYIKSSKDMVITYKPSTYLVTISTKEVAFDGFYIGGRFATATSEANINADTTVDPPTGLDKYCGPSGNWDQFNAWSTNIKFTQDGNNSSHYYLNTYRTIAQLSEDQQNSPHDPFYFVVHDKTKVLISSNNAGDNFQRYIGPTASGTALTLNPADTVIDYSKELRFNNKDNQSDGRVVIHLDTSSYNTSAHTGTLKIWYTLEDETPAAADSVNISANPSPLTVGKQRTITASLVNKKDGSTLKAESLTYKFTIYDSSNNKVSIDTSKLSHTYGNKLSVDNNVITVQTDNDVATIKYIQDTAGTYTYKVEVDGQLTNDSSALRTIYATTTAEYKNAGVYYTSNNLATSLNNPGWTEITGNTADINQTITAGNSFTFTLSSEAAFVKGFEEYDYSNPDNRYYDIKKGQVTVTTIDGEEESVATYIVTARPGCTISKITIDKVNKTIRATATFTQSTSKIKDSSEKVTYYFAEQADEMGTSNPNTNPADNIGMRIAYWNNSIGDCNNNTTKVNVVDGVDVNGYIGKDGNNATIATISGTQTNKNNIFIKTSELNASSTAWTTGTPCFKIYAVKLPIWATSFRFIKNDDSAIGAEPVNMNENQKQDNTSVTGEWNHSLALNPNRVYLLYNYKVNNVERYFVKGVILDKSLWTNNRTTNYTSTEKFSSNVINYKDISKLEDPTDGVNSGLSTAYGSTFTNPLYFGYFTKNAGSWSNFRLVDNVAQRKNDYSYFASIWDLTGVTTSSIATQSSGLRSTMNKNKYGLLLSSDSSKVHPLFDFRKNGTNGATSNGVIYNNNNIATVKAENVDFEFYKSEHNGITTYSYDSMTDYNRLFDTSNNKWYSTTSSNGKQYAFGKDTDKKEHAGLFPFGGNTNEYSNTGFGIEFDIDFYMSSSGYLTTSQNKKQDIVFNFSGDDDVWVYVDGVRILDLGGAHKISAASINFSKGKVFYKSAAKSTSSLGASSTTESFASSADEMKVVDFEPIMEAYGQKFEKTDATKRHTFQMFYMERGAFQSNCSISFNLPQASGLNINNKVQVSNVNDGLKEDALNATRDDYFAYSIQDKTASDTEKSAVDALGKGTPWSYSSDLAAVDYTSPLYPQFTNMLRQFAGVTYRLTKASGSETSSSTAFSVTSSFKDLANVVFNIKDPYLANPDADDTTVTSKTGSDGVFHLLGNQSAQFDSKVPANTLVSLKQKVELGTVQQNGNEPISYKVVPNNETGNYYLTSYNIIDDSSSKLIYSSDSSIITDDLLVADGRSSSNGFYYSNYSEKTEDKRARMTVNFFNEVAVGSIRIEKKLDDNTTPNKTFYYQVKFGQIFGDTDNASLKTYSNLMYRVFNISDNSEVYESAIPYGNKIGLKPGQYALIEGIPVETRYKVIELGTGGYSPQSIEKTAYKGGFAIGNNGVISGTKVSNPDSSLDSQYPNNTFYYELLEGKEHNETSDRSVIISETQGNVTEDYTYYTNMIPVIEETQVNDDYVSLSDIKFVNQKESITVTFKYYDRVTTNNVPAAISNTPSTYSKNYTNLDDFTIYDDDEHTVFSHVDYKRLIQTAAIAFYTETGGSAVKNTIDDYKIWASQTDALAGIASEINLNTGNAYGSGITYHTTSTGTVQSAQNNDGEKWVTYLNESGKDITLPEAQGGKNFDPEDTDNHHVNAITEFENIKQVVVWLYNVPRSYTVNVYGAKQWSDLQQATNPKISGAYVAKTSSSSKSVNKTAYYSQRVGKPENNEYLDSLAYLAVYGIDGIISDCKPADLVYSSLTNSNTVYDFAYWSYDPNGVSVASTEKGYGYRIYNDTDLYAVYVPSGQRFSDSTHGLTIEQNQDDVFVDSNGDSRTRLNVTFTPYNCPDYDENIKHSALINVNVTNVINRIKANNPTYTPDQIIAAVKEIQSQFDDQLTEYLQSYADFSRKINYAYTPSITVSLTMNGYVFDTFNSSASNYIQLTNKNRMLFTCAFKTDSLYSKYTSGANEGKYKNNVGILQIGAMDYNGEWILSDNRIVRYFHVDNA